MRDREQGSPKKSVENFGEKLHQEIWLVLGRHFDLQPRLGISPVIFDCRGGDSQCLSGLFNRQAGKKTKLDQLGLTRIPGFKFLQGLVQRDQIEIRRFDLWLGVAKFNALILSASFMNAELQITQCLECEGALSPKGHAGEKTARRRESGN